MILFRMHPVLIAAAVLPALVLMLYVYRLDRLEREPKQLLWMLILQGIFSTSVAAFLERMGGGILKFIVAEDSLFFELAENFLVVGLVEEGCKYLFLKWRTWNNPNFNCRFDGIVYAVFVSLGFALWENLYYVVVFGLDGALVRAVTAIPGHASFGVFMGTWYGLAKTFENRGAPDRASRCRKYAVLLPTFLHGTYDWIAARENGSLTLLFILFAGLTFLSAFITLNKVSKKDQFL